MKFGIFLCSQHHESDDSAQRFQELVEQTRLASELGFDSIWAGEHHVPAPFQYFNQFGLLSRLSAHSGDMLVGTNLVLLPLQHPVHVAEQGAMLDVMTDGRFVLGAGLGFRPEEFDAFGVPIGTRVRRMVEAVDIIDGLWTRDHLTYEGTHFTLADVNIRPRPRQHPRPPIWIGATVDAAVQRAAQIGDTWLMTSLPTMTDLTRQVALFREARGLGPSEPVELPRMLEVFVARDRDTAVQRAAEPLMTKYAAYADWGQRDLMSQESSLDADFEHLAKDRFVIGDPEEVAADLARQRDELGITHVCMRVQWPGMAQEHAMECLELLGREVLPRLRAGR